MSFQSILKASGFHLKLYLSKCALWSRRLDYNLDTDLLEKMLRILFESKERSHTAAIHAGRAHTRSSALHYLFHFAGVMNILSSQTNSLIFCIFNVRSPMTQEPPPWHRYFGCPLAAETMMYSGWSWSTSILPFLEET